VPEAEIRIDAFEDLLRAYDAHCTPDCTHWDPGVNAQLNAKLLRAIELYTQMKEDAAVTHRPACSDQKLPRGDVQYV